MNLKYPLFKSVFWEAGVSKTNYVLEKLFNKPER